MASQTSLSGINASGRIAGGHSYSVGFSQYYYSFVYNGNTFTTVAGPNSGAGATGINDAGQVVGLFSDSTGTHGFLNTNGALTTINDPDATVSNGTSATEALGLNNAGQIVGIFFSAGSWNGFLDTNGTFTTINDPLANLAAGGTWATGINNNSQIVGYYFDATETRYGFVDTGGTFTTISDPSAAVGTSGSGTIANGINDAGAIVGSYFDASGGQHGFVDINGVFTTIDIPGATATTAAGINSSGVIVGTWYGSDNLGHGFEATPITPVAPPTIPRRSMDLIPEAPSFLHLILVFSPERASPRRAVRRRSSIWSSGTPCARDSPVRRRSVGLVIVGSIAVSTPNRKWSGRYGCAPARLVMNCLVETSFCHPIMPCLSTRC
jgi:probable HAF family extracellular repeat protein